MQERITHTAVIKAARTPRDTKIRACWRRRTSPPSPFSAERHVKARIKQGPAQVPQLVTEWVRLSPSSDFLPESLEQSLFVSPLQEPRGVAWAESGKNLGAELKGTVNISLNLSLESSLIILVKSTGMLES